MTRHAVVLLTALALVAGACSGSEPVGFVPPPTPVIAATPSPAAPATATPVPEPTATAAPTPTPEPTEEELAVIAAWERYVVLTTESRGKDPSAKSLEYTSYHVGSSLTRAAEVAQEDRDAGEYLSGSTRSLDPNIERLDDLTAVIEDCMLMDVEVRSRTTDDVLESLDGRVPVRARLELTEDGWRVAAFERGEQTCDA